jgi:penicillin-binding protein 2
MKLFPTDMRQQRMLAAVFTITFVIGILLTAFFQTQVVSGSQFARRAEENRLRPVVIPAPRGTIVDRNGRVVATSVTAYSVSVLPGDSLLIRATLDDLAPFLGLSGSAVDTLMVRRNRRPHDLLEVTSRATFSQAAAIEERRAAFPNLLVVERPQRYYPAGPAVGHLAGYVSEITRDELERPKYRDAGYQQGQIIGRAGIEREYELKLRGVDGARYVEVDAKGRVVDPRASVGALAPRPGAPVQLTLDLDLQSYVHEIFPDSMRGAMVALVPSTGEVLALYSNPTYDPNAFVGRLSPLLWRELNTSADKPLLNRVISARYPPASTWKTATAVIGVAQGMVNADSYMPLACTGGMAYAGRYARCHYARGHGRLNLARAIEKSCNVYFYQLGIKLGLQTLLREGARLGFNRKTGIDLPAETEPQFPRDVAQYGRWVPYVAPSDVLSFSIGQGANSQTVINMATFYAAIAGDGTSRAPHIVRGDTVLPKIIDLGLDREGLTAIWEGLRLVTESEGTAVQSSLARYKLYGKTGTAQNPQGADHGWFVGFAGVPGRSPEILVATIIEHGLHGDAAAPLAAKVANFYLDRVHRHPFDPIPTWGERIRAGVRFEFDPPNRRLEPPVPARRN